MTPQERINKCFQADGFICVMAPLGEEYAPGQVLPAVAYEGEVYDYKIVITEPSTLAALNLQRMFAGLELLSVAEYGENKIYKAIAE